MNIKIDEIIRSGRRTIALEITRDARLVVRAPRRTPVRVIEDAVAQKSDWVRRKLADARARDAKYPPKRCAEGESFELLGAALKLVFDDNAKEVFARDGLLIVPRSFEGDAERAVTAFYRAEALMVLKERAGLFAGRAGVSYSSLRITGALSRWGSCSSAGGLCFTWRLAMAPLEMIDYVVVHELSHIGHPDHSAAFWRRVAELMPDFAVRREWLRKNSALLRRDFFAPVA